VAHDDGTATANGRQATITGTQTGAMHRPMNPLGSRSKKASHLIAFVAAMTH